MKEKITTMAIPERIKDELDKLKIHKRETYADVLERLIAEPKGEHQ